MASDNKAVVEQLVASSTSPRAIGQMMSYVEDHKLLPSRFKTVIDVVNLGCLVVEDANKKAPEGARIHGADKKELAGHILRETLPVLHTQGLLNNELFDQALKIVNNPIALSGLIDSVVAIWNEMVTKRGFCRLFSCCCEDSAKKNLPAAK
jgi:hypothetical protein